MLDGLIRASLRHRALVLLFAVVWTFLGIRAVRQLPVDVFPSLDRPTVTVLTEAGGLSPEEVELAVSRPIEQTMNGAPGVARVRSVSTVGLSIVWVEFGWSSDVLVARQQVAERLDPLRDTLPADTTPMLGPVTSIMGEILLVGLSSPDGSVSGPDVRRVAETQLRPSLSSLPGVSQVVAIGGGLETIEVEVHPEALAARGITLDEVRRAASEASAATTGGFLERKSQEYLVRALARTTDPTDFAATVVTRRDGVPVTLGDVATVRRGVGVVRGTAGVDGRPGVVLSIGKQPGTSTLALTDTVERELAALGEGLPPGVEVKTLFRQATFIEAAVGNVEEALFHGAILVVIVLVAFLWSWRTTVVSLTAIPLSFVTSGVVLWAMGQSIDTMTLGGLAIASGELVDDAIVDVENVLRRLRENAALPSPRPTLRVVFEASSEIRNSIVFSTILVVLVFVPLFALPDLEGRLFAPLGLAYVTSIASSLLVSMTVTPALASWLLPGSAAKNHEDSWVVRTLKAWDRRLLGAVLPRPRLVLAVVTLLVVVAAASVPSLPSGFLPPFQEGTATINLLARPGTSLEESDHLGALAEGLVARSPEVASTGRRTGRAEQDEHAEGVHYSEIDVDFHDGGRPRALVLAEIRANLARLPGVEVNVGQPISHRLDHLLSGVRAAIVIKLSGDDLGVLRAEAAHVEAALASIDGLVDLQVERQVQIPQIHVRIDRERAARFGVTPGHLAEDVQTAIGGSVVAEVVDGLRTLDVVVRYREDARNDLDVLRATPIEVHDGRVVALSQVADVELGAGPNTILHENGRRRIAVSANAAGRDVGSVVADVQAALDARTFPAGVTVAVEGRHERQRAATRSIAALSVLSLLGMYGVLYGHFRTHRAALQVLANVPLALVGAVAALWLTGSELSVATLVGFVTLCGIATRNTILMLSHYHHLMTREGMAMGDELVVRGALERLVPVVMTALCAGTALIPLALAEGAPGKEILTPVARVILGGLVSSTLLDLFVTPTLFRWWGAPPPPTADDLGADDADTTPARPA